MKIKFYLFICPFLILSIISSCTKDVYNPDVCFKENVLPIFISKCSLPTCHNSINLTADYDFTTYEGIMKGIKPKHSLESEIYKVIKGNNPRMPVGGKLSDKEVTYIKIWIKMGAPNSSNCSNCDTTKFTYSGRISGIMNTWCAGCHNASNQSGGYNLSSYTGVAQSIFDGKLLACINFDAGYPQMPSSNSKLDDCAIKAITKWVNAGYTNN